MIRGFKGTLDFYVHRGLPCVRKWPRAPSGARSAASQVTARQFAHVASVLSTASASIRDAGIAAATGSTLTWRDIWIRAYFGRLIDTMAIEIDVVGPGPLSLEATLQSVLARLDVALSTRALESGGNLDAILASLDVALSTRAAEAGGNLDAILASLDVPLSTLALESGGVLEALLAQVPALVWGYTDRYAEKVQNLNASAGFNALTGSIVPAGQVWVVTQVTAYDATSAPASIQTIMNDSITGYSIARVNAPAPNTGPTSQGWWVLRAGDCIEAIFWGVTLNDDIFLEILGHKMSLT